MEVVLRQDVDHVGLRGEVVNVARGYARNYLLPRGMAELATPGLKRELERRESLKARSEAKTTGEAEAIAKKIEATELTFAMNAGPTGALFGSVTATNVVDRLWDEQKIRLDRRKLGLQTIKRIGRYTVPVEVFADVTAELRILVTPEDGILPPEPQPEPEVAEAPAEATTSEAAVAEADTAAAVADEPAADVEAEAAAPVEAEPAAEAVAEPEVAEEEPGAEAPEPEAAVVEAAPEAEAPAEEPVEEAAVEEPAAEAPAAEPIPEDDTPATGEDEK